MKSNENQQAKKGGAPNQGSLQAYIQNYTKEAIDAIVNILRTTRNEALKMGAAKVIIDKSIADIKSVELSGKNGEPIKLNVIAGADYFAWRQKVNASSGASALPSTPTVQDFGVAQKSEKDINGNPTVGKLESA